MNTYFVEGYDDQKFVEYFLEQILKKENNSYKVLSVDGKGNFKKFKNYFKRQKESSKTIGKYFIILDEDDEIEKEKHEKILKDYKQNNIIDDYFFIKPDLEKFLLSSIEDEYNKCKECFEKYETCIEENLSSKSKWYAYFECKYKQKAKEKLESPWGEFDYSKGHFGKLKSFLENKQN